MVKPAPKLAMLNLGFRPFFLGAAIFAVVSMLLWMGVYVLQLPLPITRISTFQWHAHEMIYGFAMAVIDRLERHLVALAQHQRRDIAMDVIEVR